jgi:predicted RNA-binding Zn-ribbon protein involved in translation (DUF1610 family)
MAIEGIGEMSEPKHCPNCGWVAVSASAFEDETVDRWTCPECGEVIDDEPEPVPEDVLKAARFVLDNSDAWMDETRNDVISAAEVLANYIVNKPQ